MADHREHVRRVIAAALAAADPYQAVARAVERDWAGSSPTARTCVLVGAGKASVAMAKAVIEVGKVRPVAGVIVAPPAAPGFRAPPSFVGGGVRLIEADHPLPTQRNLVAAQAVLDAVRIAAMRKLPLVAVFSGGASAHLTLPDRGMTLADIRAVTDALMRSGAPIHELNAVRKHVEKLKGGRLAQTASPSPVQAFILSDVPGDQVEVVASGPTSADPTTFDDALKVLETRGALDAAAAIAEHLRAGSSGKHPETLKPGHEIMSRVRNTIVGSNSLAVVAATDVLKSLGFTIAEARFEVQGEARSVGAVLAQSVIQARRERGAGTPVAMIWGGETTVRLGTAKANPGGRNQELALAAALRFADEPDVVLASFATDGVDGVAPAGAGPVAGGLVTGRSVDDAKNVGVDMNAALEAHDSYRALKSINAHLGDGPTGTNVNDLAIALAY